MFILLGLAVGLVGLLTFLTMCGVGHLVNEVPGIRADLTHFALAIGGLHQEIIGRLDDEASENQFRYNYLSQATSDVAFVTTRLEQYRPLDSENPLHDMVIGGGDANLQ